MARVGWHPCALSPVVDQLHQLMFCYDFVKAVLSTNDNTSYMYTQLSKNIKASMLPKQYHVVLDEAYQCTEQEMSSWKGHDLPVEKDAFNY